MAVPSVTASSLLYSPIYYASYYDYYFITNDDCLRCLPYIAYGLILLFMHVFIGTSLFIIYMLLLFIVFRYLLALIFVIFVTGFGK